MLAICNIDKGNWEKGTPQGKQLWNVSTHSGRKRSEGKEEEWQSHKRIKTGMKGPVPCWFSNLQHLCRSNTRQMDGVQAKTPQQEIQKDHHHGQTDRKCNPNSCIFLPSTPGWVIRWRRQREDRTVAAELHKVLFLWVPSRLSRCPTKRTPKWQ